MILALVVACRPVDPPPAHDLQPLEDNRAATPADLDVLTVASGEDLENDRYWAHARATVAASPLEVWDALSDLEVIVDRREVDVYSMEPDPSLGFDRAFQVDNEANDILTVRYRLTWIHEVQLGTAEEPEQIGVRWDKTDGTPFIDLLSGTVQIVAGPRGTELDLIEHLRAPARDETTLVQYLTDLFDDLQAFTRHEPLQTFD